MKFELPPLPYPKDGLSPHISAETLEFHYEKHHKTYVDNLNKLVPNTEYENMDLESIIKKASGPIFNNAAQVWNHTFFWHCMTPQAKTEPEGKLREALDKEFNSFKNFKEKFSEASIKQFGSGWGWLIRDKQGSLKITSTSNAENPLTEGSLPLLTCDVWEHAYYIDYRNKRPDFLEAFFKLINWKFVEKNLYG